MSYTLHNGDILAVDLRRMLPMQDKQKALYAGKAERPDGGDYPVTIFPIPHLTSKNTRRSDALLNLSHPAIATFLGSVKTHEYSGEVYYTPELAAARSHASRVLPAVLFDELRVMLPALVELHKAGLHHGQLGCQTIRQTVDGTPIITGLHSATLGGSEQSDVQALARYCAEVLGAEPKIPVEVFLKRGNRRVNKRLRMAIKGALGDGDYAAITTMAAFDGVLTGKKIIRPAGKGWSQKKDGLKRCKPNRQRLFDVKRPAIMPSDALWSGLAGLTALCVGVTALPGAMANPASNAQATPKLQRLQTLHAARPSEAIEKINFTNTWMDQANTAAKRKAAQRWSADTQTASLVSRVSGMPIMTDISLTVGDNHNPRIRKLGQSTRKIAPVAKITPFAKIAPVAKIVPASFVPSQPARMAKPVTLTQEPAVPSGRALRVSEVEDLAREETVEEIAEDLKANQVAEEAMPVPTPTPIPVGMPLSINKVDERVEDMQLSEGPAPLIMAEPVLAPVVTKITIRTEPIKPVKSLGDMFRDCVSCPDMKVLPGLDSNQLLAVALTETTVSQYRAFLSAQADMDLSLIEGRGRGPLNPGFEQSDKHPVTYVSREDAKAYALWLSQKTGSKYRLPTSAEWSYLADAAQAVPLKPSKQCAFANGADIALLEELPRRRAAKCNDQYIATAPVKSFPENTNGLYDLLGNVSEWTLDASGAALPISKGGSWMSYGEDFSLNAARVERKGTRAGDIGFRLIMELD